MILIRNIALDPVDGEQLLREAAAVKLKVEPENILSLKIVKKSLDARKKDAIRYIYSVAVRISLKESKVLKRCQEASKYIEPEYAIEKVETPQKRPVIAGFGPAGMFAALVLAKAGAEPIILERGLPADERKTAVDAFRAGGELNERANVQFGEGGAGTFSDGKLNTGIKDVRLHWVLEQFYKHGAPESVTYDSKPHIGTDILIDVVKNIRREVIALGGEVRFEHQLVGLRTDDGHLKGVRVIAPDGEYSLECDELILAVGHSARDTFEMLNAAGIPMEPKPFSMGVRIEHLQSDINRAQYGSERDDLPACPNSHAGPPELACRPDIAGPILPAADYSLNVHLPDGNSAYTFCMCPGGEVFAAASEKGGVVTNGMSYSARDGKNANAALLVTLHTEDFPDRGVLSGMYWQRDIEQAAYRYGDENYRAPAQLVGDFLNNIPSTGQGRVTPTYRPGVVWGDIGEVLPKKITEVLRAALPELGRKLKGFDDPEAVLTAPETRSSSPVRILRGSAFSSELEGLYPCGEGAGYAGGISSAAVDGMRCAEAVLKKIMMEQCKSGGSL